MTIEVATAVKAGICVRCYDASHNICPTCGRCDKCPAHPGCADHGTSK